MRLLLNYLPLILSGLVSINILLQVLRLTSKYDTDKSMSSNRIEKGLREDDIQKKLPHGSSLRRIAEDKDLRRKWELKDLKTHHNSCYSSATVHAIVHASKEPDIIAKLASSAPRDGFLAWAKDTKYDNSLYIPTSADPCKGLAFYWTIDKVEESIHIAAAVYTGSEQGFIAIGFSEIGGTRGSDVVYFTSSSLSAIDGHILESLSAPMVDKEQDWTLNNHLITEDGYLIFEVSRKLVTDDVFDRAFVDDSPPFVSNHRLIGAWGPHEYISYHGDNRVHQAIQLFTDTKSNGYDTFLQEVSTQMEGWTDLVTKSNPIPQLTSYYHDECFENADLIDLGFFTHESQRQYVIGYEFLLPGNTRKYIHHIVVLGNYGDCKDNKKSLVFVYTPGDDFFSFPEGTGMKFGEGGFHSISLQFHVENRNLDSGIFDSGSGIRLFHSRNSIKDEIGMAMIGDPFVNLDGVEVGGGLTRHSFTCPSTCTQSKLDANTTVTIVKEELHMHSHGRRIVNQVIRNDSVVHESFIDYYDFDQSAGPSQANPPFELKQGDKFRTMCYYGADSDTIFGTGTKDEMCMAFIFYFPKQALSFCGVQLNDERCRAKYDGKINLESSEEFGRVFGASDIFSLT